MRKRFVALTLVFALILTLGAVTAVAGEETAIKVLENAAPGLLIAPNPNATKTDEAETEETPLAGPDEKTVPETPLDEETEKLITKVTTEPTKLESLAFDKLEKQLRSGNLSLLALEENIVEKNMISASTIMPNNHQHTTEKTRLFAMELSQK